jgi:HEPN domain-containing protein
MRFNFALSTLAREHETSELFSTADFLVKYLPEVPVEEYPGKDGQELSRELRTMQFELYHCAKEIRKRYFRGAYRNVQAEDLGRELASILEAVFVLAGCIKGLPPVKG